MKRLYKISVFASLLLLSACSDNNTVQQKTIQGRIVDSSAIEQATVFYDINKNGLLDKSEPQTQSNEKGFFTLNISQELANDYTIPLVSKNGYSTFDNKRYTNTLMALRDKKEKEVILTPLSTLIAVDVLENLNQRVQRVYKASNSSNTLLELLEKSKQEFAKLLDLEKALLTQDPIELALKKNNTKPLEANIKVSKVAQELKKALKKEIKEQEKKAIQSFKALSKALKKAQKSGDEALKEAVEYVAEVAPESFDKKVIQELKESVKTTLEEFNQQWQEQKDEIIKTLKEQEGIKTKEDTNSSKTPTHEINKTKSKDKNSTQLQENNISKIEDEIKEEKNTTKEISKELNDTKENSTTIEQNKTKERTAKIKDTTPPTITLKGENPQIIEFGQKYQELGATLSDDKDSNPTLIIDTSKLNLDKLGEYKVIYIAKDSAGNEANATRIVKVVDTTPPTITLFGDNNITLELNEEYKEAGFEAIDNYDGNITNKVKILGSVQTDTAKTYTLTYSVTDSSNNSATATRTITVIDPYSYIPKANELSDAVAMRFLNKATFGADKNSLNALKEKGVVAWLDEQLNMPLREDEYLRKTIEIAKEAEPDKNPDSIEDYLADNDIVFNKKYASFHSPRWMESAWFDIAMTAPDQLRQKVTYALSQIIVESDFEPIFIRRGEALSRYFDILAKNAFANYKQLLTDISFNSGMSLFLTYNGNKKLHLNEANVSIYPDENYAREIMQLFSIGLNKLNMDGTPQKDAQGNLIPTYTQDDVNELARVFTGWDIKRNTRFGLIGFTRGDLTHPIEFTQKYHDFGEKKVLGKTIPAGLSGEDDIKAAIDIIMSNSNVAPFISKNLIMRLTKSNPSPAYIQRVATVFANTQGDLKEVVKAIFLDKEIWDDMKELKSVKFKEPVVALMNLYRRLEIKPLPYWYFCGFGGPSDDNATNCTRVHNKFLFNNPTPYAGQGPGRAPTVFNFYNNDFVPNDAEFKATKEVAPEVQIQNDTILIKFNNKIRDVFNWEEVRMLANSNESIEEIIQKAPANKSIPYYYIGADKYYFNLQEDYDFLEARIDGDTDGDFEELKDSYQKGDIEKINKAVKEYIDYVDQKLTGGLLSDEEKEVIYQQLTKQEKGFYNHWAGDDTAEAKIRQIMSEVLRPLYRFIITSDKFMTE